MSAASILPVRVAAGSAPSWDELDARYAWIRALRGCPQDPVHHAEGDVWIHTRAVYEAMLLCPGFLSGTDEERAELVAAALLHDVAKPLCTRTEDDGRVTARGHARKGAVMARRILWEMDWPRAMRERVCALVRHHLLPFFCIEGDDAEARAITAAQTARWDHLVLLAESDALGRECEDQERLLTNIGLCTELAGELGIERTPFAFAGDHARVTWFRKKDRDPRYAAYDDTCFEVTVVCGLPGAGKDTWLEREAGSQPWVSLDAIREELRIRPRDDQAPVLVEARERARMHLRAKRSFVWNATNLTTQLRGPLLGLFLDYGARLHLVAVECRASTLWTRNAARDPGLPPAALNRLIDRWEAPDAGEAHRLTILESDA